MSTPDQMWTLLLQASEELAEELGLETDPRSFSPATLRAIDAWLAEHEAPLDEDEATRLGCFLGRILCETHNGGLVQIHQKDHPLDGEWAITGFARGLANDFHVPFLVSATRIGIERNLTTKEWYRQVLAEGR
ncbi:MAG: hypothetical protein EXR72_07305 [Myxococcales bacterium]|nr:hypothetical protein [Myxococcales bacterium]